MFARLMQQFRALLAYGWGYMGTLAAMGLLIGVLGMGIYHACTEDARFQAIRCFGGVFNSADATPPSGLDELSYSAAHAVPHLRFEYGEGGRLERLVHISAEGHPSAMPGSHVSEQRLEYDSAGRITRKSNYTATGAPATDAAGVHARAFAYDDAGRLVRTEFLDRAGKRVVPRMPGFAIEKMTYDEKGRPLTIEYLDGKENPIVNARGERRVVFNYDDAHHGVTRTNYIAGSPADDMRGIACEKRYTTQDGRSTVTTWYNAEGKHVHHPESGAASLLTEVSHDGAVYRERRCEESGAPCRSAQAVAERVVRTTPRGLVEWECFNDADGMPCLNAALGYAERICEYGADGALMREFFWDAVGNPCNRYEKRYCTTENGAYALSLLNDGSTEVRRVVTN